MKSLLVSDLMTREPVTIDSEANLLECAKKMVKKKVGSLIISDGKIFKGFISNEDILWVLIKKSAEELGKINALAISPRKVVTIKPDATLEEALKKMKNLKFERLPVVQNKELVGMITIKDILSFHPEIYPEVDEFAQIKEEEEKLRRIKEKGLGFRDGICEECGKRGFLQKFNGMIVCESCMNSA